MPTLKSYTAHPVLFFTLGVLSEDNGTRKGLMRLVKRFCPTYRFRFLKHFPNHLPLSPVTFGSIFMHEKVQFERLFGILFLRGLAQLKEFHHSGHGIEDGGATGPVSSVPLVGGDIGSRHDGTHFAASAGVDDCSTGVGLRVFKDRELEVSSAVC